MFARAFLEPFEVLQFWVSDEYAVHRAERSGLTGELIAETSHAGRWLFKLSRGEDSEFVGDYLPFFLPTRKNILAFEHGCSFATLCLEMYTKWGEVPNDMGPLFRHIEPYQNGADRDFGSSKYREDLFQVIRSDWGINLPPIEHLGEREIVLEYRLGLPCAAAMCRAVTPILKQVWGELRLVQQSVLESQGRTIDTLTYEDAHGNVHQQHFDITEYFGKMLADKDFNFSLEVADEDSGAS